MKLSSAASILFASIGSTYSVAAETTTTPSLESANNSIDVDGLNNRVETSCERDVVDICRGGYGRREEEVMNPFTTKLGGMQATYPTPTLLLTSSMMNQPADPFLEWMLVPSTTFYYQEFPSSSSVVEEPQQKQQTPPTPPEVNDLSLFFDRMFGSTTGLLLSSPSFYVSPSSSEENENGNEDEDASSSSFPHHREMTKKEDVSSPTSSLITISSSSSSSSSSPAILFELVEYVVDSGVTKLASELGYEEESRSEEIPDLARQIQSRGREMLLRENDRGEGEGDDENDATATMRRRMARRLTEVDSTSIRENLLALRLPFGHDNCCLKGAHRRGFTSPECAEALDEMYAKFAEGKAALAQAQEREEAVAQKPQRDLELQRLKLLRSTHDDSSSFVYCPVFVGAVLSTALSVTLLVFWFLRVCCRICDDDEEEDDNDEDQEGYYALMEDGEEKRNLLRAKNLVFEGVPVQVV